MTTSERVRALDPPELRAFAERVCARLERVPGPDAARLLGRGRGLAMRFAAWEIGGEPPGARGDAVRELLDWSIATRSVFAR